MATRLKTQERKQGVNGETEENGYTNADEEDYDKMAASLGLRSNKTTVDVVTSGRSTASHKLNARTTPTRTKNVRVAAEAWQTRTAIAEEGKRGREATREEGKAARETTVKVGQKILNETTKSLMKLNEVMNKNFEALNTNMLESNKQLNLIIKDLGDGVKAQILQLNGNLIEGFKQAFENQDLATAEIKAKIDAAIDGFKSDISGLKGIMNKNKEDLLRKLREKADEDKLKWEKFAGDLDGFKKEWKEKEKEKEKELERAREASEKYKKLKEIKRVMVCNQCRGTAAHSSQCQVTWGAGGQIGGFRLKQQFELAMPQALVEAIGGILKEDLGTAGLYRIQHNLILDDNLTPLRMLIDEYTRDPDAFIEKYVLPPGGGPPEPLPISRVGLYGY
jgi:hypothetical protein